MMDGLSSQGRIGRNRVIFRFLRSLLRGDIPSEHLHAIERCCQVRLCLVLLAEPQAAVRHGSVRRRSAVPFGREGCSSLSLCTQWGRSYNQRQEQVIPTGNKRKNCLGRHRRFHGVSGRSGRRAGQRTADQDALGAGSSFSAAAGRQAGMRETIEPL